jgi:hypothetical protein
MVTWISVGILIGTEVFGVETYSPGQGLKG